MILIERCHSEHFGDWSTLHTTETDDEVDDILKSPPWNLPTGDVLRIGDRYYIVGDSIREASSWILSWMTDENTDHLFIVMEMLFPKKRMEDFLQLMVCDLPRWSHFDLKTKIQYRLMSWIGDALNSHDFRGSSSHQALRCLELLENYRISNRSNNSYGTQCVRCYVDSYSSYGLDSGRNIIRYSEKSQHVCNLLRQYFGFHDYAIAVLRKIQ